jgi:hypothetical protein
MFSRHAYSCADIPGEVKDVVVSGVVVGGGSVNVVSTAWWWV